LFIILTLTKYKEEFFSKVYIFNSVMSSGSPPGRAGAALLVYMCNRWYRAR
jgi:hypothetical protein